MKGTFTCFDAFAMRCWGLIVLYCKVEQAGLGRAVLCVFSFCRYFRFRFRFRKTSPFPRLLRKRCRLFLTAGSKKIRSKLTIFLIYALFPAADFHLPIGNKRNLTEDFREDGAADIGEGEAPCWNCREIGTFGMHWKSANGDSSVCSSRSRPESTDFAKK